jgi:hypothetical protein
VVAALLGPQSANVGLTKNRSGAKLVHYGVAKALKAPLVRQPRASPDGVVLASNVVWRASADII